MREAVLRDSFGIPSWRTIPSHRGGEEYSQLPLPILSRISGRLWEHTSCFQFLPQQEWRQEWDGVSLKHLSGGVPQHRWQKEGLSGSGTGRAAAGILPGDCQRKQSWGSSQPLVSLSIQKAWELVLHDPQDHLPPGCVLHSRGYHSHGGQGIALCRRHSEGLAYPWVLPMPSP